MLEAHTWYLKMLRCFGTELFTVTWKASGVFIKCKVFYCNMRMVIWYWFRIRLFKWNVSYCCSCRGAELYLSVNKTGSFFLLSDAEALVLSLAFSLTCQAQCDRIRSEPHVWWFWADDWLTGRLCFLTDLSAEKYSAQKNKSAVKLNLHTY